MKTKLDNLSTRALIVIMLIAVILLLLLLWRPVGATTSNNENYPILGYPTAWGYPPPYPAPVDPMCEEAALLDLPGWWRWCPMIGEAVSTEISAPDATATPALAMKVGGRIKGVRR